MDTNKIRQHYDSMLPYYEHLWDKHLHHGYYITGKESKSKATQQLVDFLTKKVELKKNSKILDIGCGIGATSIYFSNKFNCDVTGITISSKQVERANELSKNLKNKPSFFVHDANNLKLNGNFDLIWSIEMISHLNKRNLFFKRVSNLMKKNSKWCIAGWIKDSFLSEKEYKKYIKPIEEGMVVNLPTEEEYFKHFNQNHLKLIYYQDISKRVSKTWDISLNIIKNPKFWYLAAKNGSDFIKFLKSFKAMRKGFKSGSFRYIVMVVQKE